MLWSEMSCIFTNVPQGISSSFPELLCPVFAIQYWLTLLSCIFACRFQFGCRSLEFTSSRYSCGNGIVLLIYQCNPAPPFLAKTVFCKQGSKRSTQNLKPVIYFFKDVGKTSTGLIYVRKSASKKLRSILSIHFVPHS